MSLLSIAETAKELGVSDRTVRRLIDQNEIPAYRVMGAWRLDLSEVKARLKHEPRGNTKWQSTNVVTLGTLTSRSAAKELDSLLKHRTGKTRKRSMTD